MDVVDLTLAAISWEPTIRGALAVLIGFVVLCGSVYLLVATNSGARTGLLITIAGLFGWFSVMGVVWWVYGIGWKGDAPSWEIIEINFDGGQTAVTEVVAEDHDLESWEVIAVDNPAFGELQAAATAALTEQGIFETTADFVIADAHETGGKPQRESDSMVDRVTNRIQNTFTITNPEHYAVVRVQGAVDPGETEPGQPPPVPEADPEQPEIAVILERNIGNLRVRPAVFTIVSMIVFGITANVLHRRDKREAENRARDDELVEV
jgi:hypothetical protein